MLRFQVLIEKLDYSNIKLLNIPKYKPLKRWCYDNMPLVVEELYKFGWDLEDYSTWLETVFLQNIVQFYNKKVGLYITSSYVEYLHSKKFINSKVSNKFRRDFGLDCHAVILVHPVVFLTEEDLDDIYVSLDFDNGWSQLDMSKTDEETDTIQTLYQRDWGWLDDDSEEASPWTTYQTVLAYQSKVYKGALD